MKSKPYSMLLVLIAALLVRAGNAGLQQAQQAKGKVKLLRTPIRPMSERTLAAAVGLES